MPAIDGAKYDDGLTNMVMATMNQIGRCANHFKHSVEDVVLNLDETACHPTLVLRNETHKIIGDVQVVIRRSDWTVAGRMIVTGLRNAFPLVYKARQWLC